MIAEGKAFRANQILEGCMREARSGDAVMNEDVVTLDANHPLAGETVVYDMELIEIVMTMKREQKDRVGLTSC